MPYRFLLFIFIVLFQTQASAKFDPHACHNELFSPVNSKHTFLLPDYWAQRANGAGFFSLSKEEETNKTIIAFGDQGEIPTKNSHFERLRVYDTSGQLCKGNDITCHAAMVLSVMCSDNKQCSVSSPQNTTIFADLNKFSDKVSIYKILNWVHAFNKGRALEKRIRVLNLSLGNRNFEHSFTKIKDKLRLLAKQETVVVWSAGNDYDGSQNQWSWVSHTKHMPTVLAISAIKPTTDQRYAFSNFGDYIQFTNFGNHVKTHRDGLKGSGTSIAAPLTAGLFNTLFKISPQLTAKEAVNIVRATATSYGNTSELGHGLPNHALASLTARGHAHNEIDVSDSNIDREVASLLSAYKQALGHGVPTQYAKTLGALEEVITYPTRYSSYQNIVEDSRSCKDYGDRVKGLFKNHFFTKRKQYRGELCQFYKNHYLNGSQARPDLALDIAHYCAEELTDALLTRLSKEMDINLFTEVFLPTSAAIQHNDFNSWIFKALRFSSSQKELARYVLNQPEVIKHANWSSWVEHISNNNPLYLRYILSSNQAITQAIRKNTFESWVDALGTADLKQPNEIIRKTQLGLLYPILPYHVFSNEAALSQSAVIEKWMSKYAEYFKQDINFYRPFSLVKAIEQSWWLKLFEQFVSSRMTSDINGQIAHKFATILSQPHLVKGIFNIPTEINSEYAKVLLKFFTLLKDDDISRNVYPAVILEHDDIQMSQHWFALMLWYIKQVDNPDFDWLKPVILSKKNLSHPRFHEVISYMAINNDQRLVKMKNYMLANKTQIGLSQEMAALLSQQSSSKNPMPQLSTWRTTLKYGTGLQHAKLIAELAEKPKMAKLMVDDLIIFLNGKNSSDLGKAYTYVCFGIYSNRQFWNKETEKSAVLICPQVVDILIKGLEHKDHDIRAAAIWALGSIKHFALKSIPALKDIEKNDPNATVRKLAEYSIELITNP